MLDFKKEISKLISKELNMEDDLIYSFIQLTKDETNGDYSFPCFRLAKELKKSPQLIANEIKENLKIDGTSIEKVEIVGGYLNFYINKTIITKEVLNEISNSTNYGKSKIGNGKNIVIDYSAPNIAKPFHIGHLRSTVIGGALYNIYKYLGYNVTGINHLGDYGTQFGKLIEGYKLWGEEYDLEKDPINELTKIYIRINELCKKDENVYSGYTDTQKLVNFKGENIQPGDFVEVKILDAKTFSLDGVAV